MSDLEGVMLSDYLLLQCISKGGIADVYRARQKGEGNYEVAVKIFRSNYAQRESFRAYFMAEAEKIGQFDHPNILPLLEYGEGEGLLYIVTPFVMGDTLEDLLRRAGGKLSALQSLPIMQQLCDAVQYAHNHNVVHGNIKPSNVFIGADSRVLLSDFGIAHSYDDSQQSLTRVGWGSAEYVAPEQSLGLVRRASDVYSLGVLLFHILTGQPPFTGHTPVEVLLKHVRSQPPAARVLVPTISDAVEDVLTKALQKRSDHRFASVEEFGDALLAAVSVAPVVSLASLAPRPLVTRKLQLVQGDALADGKDTPSSVHIPAASQSSAVVDPQTPLPAYLVFTAPAAPSEAKQESPPSPFSTTQSVPLPAWFASPPHVAEPEPQPGAEPQAEPQADATGLAEVTTEHVKNVGAIADSSEIEEKDFLQDDDDGGGSSLFWSMEPVEWSPLAYDEEGAEGGSLTANEYLYNQPSTPEPQMPRPVMPAMSSATSIPETLTTPAMSSAASIPETLTTPVKEQVASGNGTWNARLKKILPIVVVILLLIGLLGALLSTFLLPSDPRATSSGSGIAAATQPGAVKATATTSPAQPVVPPFSCASGSLTLDGSTNFLPAMQQLANDYSKQCSGKASFTISSDGGKAGLDAVASGNADLAYSDLTSAGRPGLVDYSMGALMYAVVVNSDTQVRSLTTAQLQGIYTGHITNWSQLGGTDEPIRIVSRASGSAIRAVFEAYVLKGVAQLANGAVLFDDSNSVVAQRVLGTSGAISYISLASVPLNGAQIVSINGVSPSSYAVASNAYPFWSIERLYTHQAAKGLALSFIGFCSTSTGVNDFANAGIVPIKSMSPAALNAHTPGPTN